TAPVLSAAPDNITVECSAVPSAATITATDNCDAPEVLYNEVRTNGATANDYTLTRTWTATDVSGNSSSQTQVITVEDQTAPVLSAGPDNVTVSCGASLLPSNTGTAAATDNCTESGDINITYTDSEKPSVCGGSFTRTWTAKDESNNSSSHEQIITVTPAALPTMAEQNAVTISIACGSAPVPSTLPFTNGLSGDCELSGNSFNSTFTLVENTCGATYIESWTATDTCGREIISVSRTVTVIQDMGTLESIVFFSSEGAIGNTGVSNVTGDIGTNVGAITGFNSPSKLSGSTDHANEVTIHAKKDLMNLYIHLSNIPVSVSTHDPVFGNGETLSAGVYSIGAAGSVVGNLTLDGQNNPNSIFVFKYNGAFSVGAGSNIILTNGQKASNVFWIAEGAISIGASSAIKGTLLAHTGAVSLGAGCDLEGRMFSTTGAVTLNSSNVYLPKGSSNIPIICVNNSLSSDALLGSVAKFTLFTGAGAISNIGASGIIGDLGSNAGAITGFENSTTSLVSNIYNTDAVTAEAKADLENAYQALSNKVGNAINPALAGTTLTPGVYSVTEAGTLTGTVTLDGEGDPNAEFVIKFGGAFSTEAQSRVVLINGARSSNVFWIAEGAISLGASSFMKGTLIAHNAAVSMGARGNLEGRMLTNRGAIDFNTAVAYMSYLKCVNTVPSSRNSPTNELSSTSKNEEVSDEAVTDEKSSRENLSANAPFQLEATTLMAYPNPFVNSTLVTFTLQYDDANTTLVLYDLKGTMIEMLFNGKVDGNQKHEIKFNGENVDPGVYIFRLSTSKENKNFKVIMK
ncbi:MAG: hypothetical protein ACI9XP_001559, partial [Lentimonas sp.]